MIAYVTGAAGFLGSHLTDLLLRYGWTVVGIDNSITGNRRNLAIAERSPAFHFVAADVSLPWNGFRQNLDKSLRGPELILHFASPASPMHYGAYPTETLTVNALGTIHATELAHEVGSTILFASTSESYGNPLEHPQRETYWGNVNPVGVRSCYDESKRFGEAYVSTAARTRGIDGRLVRIFNTYGPRMQADDGRVVPSFCTSALRGEPLTIFGNGTQTRSFCYVDDLVEGIYRLATRPALGGKIVNIGNPIEYTIRELASIIAEIAGVQLVTVERELPPDDPTRRCPNIDLARNLLDWEPKVALCDGLRATLDYFRLSEESV